MTEVAEGVHRLGDRYVNYDRQTLADVDALLLMLARVEATGAGTLLPGHGEPWRDGVAAAVTQARRRAAKER